VFLLIGLQIRPIIDGVRAEHLPWGEVIPACLLVLAATVARARAIWIFSLCWAAAAVQADELVAGGVGGYLVGRPCVASSRSLPCSCFRKTLHTAT